MQLSLFDIQQPKIELEEILRHILIVVKTNAILPTPLLLKLIMNIIWCNCVKKKTMVLMKLNVPLLLL